MNYFDILILIPVLWGAFKGVKKGLIIEVASIIALFLGIWGGVKFSAVSASYLGEVFSISEKIMPIISFAVTFILIVIAVFALAKLLQKMIKLVALGTVNKITGGVFGALKFALIISVILNLINAINKDVHFIAPEMQESSILYKPITKIALIIIPGLKEFSLNGLVEEAIKEEAHNKIDEASFSSNL